MDAGNVHSIIMSPLFDKCRWAERSLTSKNVRSFIDTHLQELSYEEALRANGVFAVLWMKENGYVHC